MLSKTAAANSTARDSRPAGPPIAVRLNDIAVRLGRRLALLDACCEIGAGAFVGVLGPNGSGKSTLIRAILGMIPLASGRIEVFGKEPAAARESFAYVPQRQNVELEFPLTVWDVVMMGRVRRFGWLLPPRKEDKGRVAWALEQVDMADRRNSLIGELSFGQQQRVFFARALAQEGSILMLDEPLTGVDANTQELLLELLATFHSEGKTIIMATHDLNEAACVCDHLCFLNQRLIAYGPVAETFTPEVLRETYGAHAHFVEMPALGDHTEVVGEEHHHPDVRPDGQRNRLV